MPIRVILNYIAMAIILAILCFLVTFSLIVTKEKLWEYVGVYSFAIFLFTIEFTINIAISAKNTKDLSSSIRSSIKSSKDEVLERLNSLSRDLNKEEHFKRRILSQIKALKGTK